jgi:PAS domain S-box-containing protein
MNTPPFILAELMAGAIILASAAAHLGLAWRGVQRRLNLAFCALCLILAVSAFIAPMRYLSSDFSGQILGVKISQACVMAYGIALAWFTREYSGILSTRVPYLVTGLGALAIAAHLALPYSLRFAAAPSLRQASLPGGGVFYFFEGRPHPAIWEAHLFGFIVIGYAIAACVRLWRDRRLRQKAVAFSVGISPLVLFAWPQNLLINRGILQPPNYYSFAFLALVGIMSQDILREAVRSVALSREVTANARRWRSLLEHVSLLVLELDREGQVVYANPALLRTVEFELPELLGKPVNDLFSPDQISELVRVFERAMEAGDLEQIQTALVTRSKRERVILWSAVRLYDHADRITGMLGVGHDLTDRVSAEKARDEMMAQVAALKEQLEAENKYLRLEYEGMVDATDFIGSSDAMRYVLHKIGQVAPTNATVLIEGETGVGKELVARAIHAASPRAQMPFIRVNCAALPPNLAESELFGHERGSFTGADRSHQGRFELADHGTILLDEVGELPLDVQAKLLRVLQEGEYDRVGGSRTRKADVRIVASTNRNLRQDVAAGRFREDLYFRLQVFPISVPPLRERREDIPALVHHFAQRLARKHNRQIREVPMKLIGDLAARDWPGNVRELENVIERAVITSGGPVLTLASEQTAGRNHRPDDFAPSSLTMDAVERRHIEEILKRTNGQIAGPGGAAEILGLHPNTLRGRMAKLGVKRLG